MTIFRHFQSMKTGREKSIMSLEVDRVIKKTTEGLSLPIKCNSLSNFYRILSYLIPIRFISILPANN